MLFFSKFKPMAISRLLSRKATVEIDEKLKIEEEKNKKKEESARKKVINLALFSESHRNRDNILSRASINRVDAAYLNKRRNRHDHHNRY